MTSRKLAIAGTVAACAACCAPLVVPLVWPALAAGGLVGATGAGGSWLAGLGLDIILCAGIGAAVLAGGAVWLWQRRSRANVCTPNLTDSVVCHLETCAPGNREQEHRPITAPATSVAAQLGKTMHERRDGAN